MLRTSDNWKGVHAMLRCRNGWSIDARVLALVVVALSGALLYAPLPTLAQTRNAGGEPPPGRGRPLEVVKASFSRVLAAKGGARQAEVRRVTDELFDFHEMSRRMLGTHWQEGSEPEQEEFVRLFTDMLERVYLTNIADLPLASVQFEGELISGDYARVSSRMAGRRRDIAIEYRLIDADGRWAVYDVAVEGVSLVSSYRSQFHSILRNSSLAELLARLRSREVAGKAEQGQ